MSLKNPVTPPGIDPGTVRLVAQRLNHYANPGPSLDSSVSLNLRNIPLFGTSNLIIPFSICFYKILRPTLRV